MVCGRRLKHSWKYQDESLQLLQHEFGLLAHARDIAKKEFFVTKPQRNLKGFWSKMDVIGVIDYLGGLLSEVYKFCGNDILCVTDPRNPKEDLVKGQNIFVYFSLGTPAKSECMEKFLKEHNFLFLMANDVPFTGQ